MHYMNLLEILFTFVGEFRIITIMKKMLVRRTLLLVCAVASVCCISRGQALPQFSAAENDYWYYIEFAINASVVQDIGAGQELRNRMPVHGEEGQLWKFVGDENACTVVSKAGRNLHFNKSANRFFASSDESTPMKMVATSGGKWELQFVDASLAPSANPDAVAIVMYNGSGIDHYLDVWKHDFNACALSFTRMEDMEFSIQAPPAAVDEVAITAASDCPEEPLALWYGAPATNWVREALPIGNGDMGAMIFGGIAQDRVQFNHKTLWKGSSGATDLGSYLAFGDLYVINRNAKEATGYRRVLDMAKAAVNVGYVSAGTRYDRDYLCSNPDKVIVMRYTAMGDETLSLDLQFINAQGGKAEYTSEGATFGGTLENGMNYRAVMAVEHKGGTVSCNKQAVVVDGADELLVYITCGTDFDASCDKHLSGNVAALESELGNVIAIAREKGYEAIKADHEADYKSLFARVDFQLAGARNSVPTNLLLQRSDAASQKMVDMLVFQYGRYLTIASSRGIPVPSNLQGIWNKDGDAQHDAVWASDIHSNINVQMNYWPVEPTNLSECHMPFLTYMKNEATRAGGQWQQNARDLGIDKGWVVNTAGNIFGGSSSYKLGKYSVVNAWYCTHLWQHFAYTCDTTFLREDAMPLMKSACEFWFERLVPSENNDGTLECPYEYSPEQGYVQNATAHSQQLVTMLFEQTLQAIDVLGSDDAQCDDDFIATLRDKLNRLDKGLRIDSNGLLREWKYQENTPNIGADQNPFADDEQNVWQCHRHTSHLMALYPGFNIDRGIDEDIYNAAIKSLDDRGDVATGWARAWRISLWARARDKKRVYNTLRGFAHRTTNLGYDWHGGLYDNMLDAHATSVFQIEGNFGATAGIAEMLMQSRPDSIVLLPALPREWTDGTIKGLKAIGNHEVDLEWKDGRPVTVRIQSHSGTPLTIAYPKVKGAEIAEKSGRLPAPEYQGENTVTFETIKGGEYLLDFSSVQWEAEEYDIYEPRNTGSKNRTDRNVKSIGIVSTAKGASEYTLTTEEQSKDYVNLAENVNPVVFVAEPNETVELSVVADGTWRNHFVYVDYDGDGFTAAIEDGSNWKPTDDLVSYSFFNNDTESDADGWNSAGIAISGGDRSTPSLPTFTTPEKDGIYRMRFKQDWCNIDPQGDADGKFGDFKSNGGAIIDLLLVVGDPESDIEKVMVGSAKSKEGVYDYTGRKIDKAIAPGFYIINGKKTLKQF